MMPSTHTRTPTLQLSTSLHDTCCAIPPHISSTSSPKTILLAKLGFSSKSSLNSSIHHDNPGSRQMGNDAYDSIRIQNAFTHWTMHCSPPVALVSRTYRLIQTSSAPQDLPMEHAATRERFRHPHLILGSPPRKHQAKRSTNSGVKSLRVR
jgi:hypothetical protein